MKDKKFAFGIACVAIGGIGWGASGVCSEFLFKEYSVDAEWITSIRMILSGIILLTASFFTLKFRKQTAKPLAENRQNTKPDSPGKQIFGILTNKKDLTSLLMFAILGLLICQYAYLAAIKYSNSGTATVLQNLNVVFMIITVAVWKRTRMESNQIIAVILAVIGTYLIATKGSLGELVISPRGLIWGLLAAGGIVIYTLISQEIIEKWGNMVVTGWGMLIGGTVLTIATKAWYVPEGFDFTAFIVVAFIVLVGTAGGFSLFLHGVKYIGPVRGSLIACLEPVTATVLSVLWLGTHFGIAEIIGFCAVLATVFITALGGSTTQEITDACE